MAYLGNLSLEHPLVANLGKLSLEHALVANLGNLSLERPLVANLGNLRLKHSLVANFTMIYLFKQAFYLYRSLAFTTTGLCVDLQRFVN